MPRGRRRHEAKQCRKVEAREIPCRSVCRTREFAARRRAEVEKVTELVAAVVHVATVLAGQFCSTLVQDNRCHNKPAKLQ